MKKQTVKTAGRVGCAALALVIAMSSGGTVFASASSTQKDETVYTVLDANGKTNNTTVSDWLHSDDAAAQLLDKSDLSNIKNVKSNETPKKDGGNLIWQLNPGSTDKTGSNIYYEGTTNKQLPLSVSVKYYLDGKEIKPAQLAGKSGKVEMKINIKNNEEHTVNINGKNTTMYTPMTAIVLTMLPTDTFKNVSLSDGKLFSDGKNQFVAFATMPGLNDSLSLKSYSGIPELSDLDFPEELDIKADATNFALDTIAVAATPQLIDSDKLKSSTNIGEMRTNLNKLKKIQDDIDNVDTDKSIRSLFTNPDRTAAARLLIDDVFDFYKLDLKMTDLATNYVTNDNIKLYDRVTSDLDKADIKYLLDNKVIRGLNDRLTDENINKGRTLLKDYDEIETFDMVKFNHVVKALNHYDKLYDKFDGLFDDVRRIENHLNDSTLDTITKLSGSSIQTDLSKTMGSLNGLSKTGITGIELSDDDIEALMISYLSRGNNFETMLGSQIESMADKKGNIKVKDLFEYIDKLGLGSNGDAFKKAVIGQPELIKSFIKSNPDATINVSDIMDAFNALKSAGVIKNENSISVISGAMRKLSGDSGKINLNYFIKNKKTIGEALANALAKNGCTDDAENISSILTELQDNQDIQQELIQQVLAENPDAVLPAKDVVTAVGKTFNNLDDTSKNTIVKSIVSAVAPSLRDNLNDLLNNAGNLQTDLTKTLGKDYAGKLENVIDNLSDEHRYIKDLQDDLKNITDEDDKDKDKIDDDLDELEDVIKDKDQTDYLISWANKIKGMKNDLDDNSENIGIMRDLLKQYDDPKIKNAKNMIPTLQKDIDDARPILESLKDRLDEPAMNASFHKLPETTKTLLKMKGDIDNNRAVMNIFKKTLAPSTVSVFKNTFDTLDDFKKDGTVDDYTNKLDDADDLIAKKDEYLKLSDDYKIFTQSADGAQTKLKFVMKTAEIKAPDKTVTAKPVSTAQNAPKSSSGFFGWVKSVWSGTVKLFKNIF